MTDNYQKLSDTLQKAYFRASEGKGKERHETQEPFEKQHICKALEVFGINPALYQIEKKARECTRLLPSSAANELLDIIVYAAAAYITLELSLPIPTPTPEKKRSIEPDDGFQVDREKDKKEDIPYKKGGLTYGGSEPKQCNRD